MAAKMCLLLTLTAMSDGKQLIWVACDFPSSHRPSAISQRKLFSPQSDEKSLKVFSENLETIALRENSVKSEKKIV
jgi:hypothetical protein